MSMVMSILPSAVLLANGVCEKVRDGVREEGGSRYVKSSDPPASVLDEGGGLRVHQ